MIRTVIICGAGTMGSGIAELCARHGFHTILYELDPERLSSAATRIHQNLDALVSKGKISANEAAASIARMVFTADIRACKGDLVIEAIIEKPEAKRSLFNQLAAYNGTETIFASNTSSLSISRIAESVPGPERVCGLHFFNPAQVMKLVEVVRAPQTRADIISLLVEFCRQLGKEPVVCNDSPGFIVNRVARHYYLEPLRLAEKGLCTYAQMDALLEAAGFRMGPFRLMDLIGNDVNYAVTESLYEASGQSIRFRPSPIQRDKVNQGELGRKTGKGYYDYKAEGSGSEAKK
ncbi:MAG: 3-hydroxyacyl-CoA dehydrogenase NAD-binding domain-containing protein [Chitinophagaceae bacterium]|nr:3-hydroxyacyl-CoA dehydrogenase NAD-binding domain-containing protein [Chitinophagaceae bacterium]